MDRYRWNGSTLTFDRSIIALRALQTDNIAVTGHPGTNNAMANGDSVKTDPKAVNFNDGRKTMARGNSNNHQNEGQG